MVDLPVFWHISLQRCFGLEQLGHTQIQCDSDLYGWLIYKFAYFFLQKYNKSKIQNFGKFKIKRHATLKKIELTTIKVVDAAIKEPKTNIKDKIDKLEISRRVDF